MAVTRSPAPGLWSPGWRSSPGSESSREGGEGRDVALAVTGGLGALFAILTVLHWFFVPAAARGVMVALAAVSAVALLACHVRVRRLPVGTAVSRRWVEVSALVPIVNSVTHLVTTGQLYQTTTLMLTIIGIGVGVSAGRAAAFLGGLTLAAWGVAVAAVPALRTPAPAHYGIQLAMAAALAALAHRVLAYRKRTIAEARDRAELTSEWFGTLFEASPVGVGVADAEGRYVAVNPALCELLGRPERELIGRTGLDFTHPDDRAGRLAGSLMDQGVDEVARVEKRYLRPDGQVRWVWLTFRNVVAPDGRCYTLKHVQDVTDHHDAEQAVRDSERNLAAVAAVARRIRTGEDARSSIVEAIRGLADATSVTLVEPESDGSASVLPGVARRAPDADGPALVITACDDPALIGTRIPLSTTSVTVDVFTKGTGVFLPDPPLDPRTCPQLLALSQARSMLWQPVTAAGVTRAVIAVAWDQRVDSISDQRATAVALLADEAALALEHETLLARLEAQANTDPLTGLINRRAWDRTLDHLMERARQSGRPLTIAIADLDRFKLYNDTHGHAAGDQLLAATAEAFEKAVRHSDLVARWGGEEFALALPDCAPAHAAEVLERVRLSVPLEETCSIGYATWNRAESAIELLSRADTALYVAKNTGRNRISGELGSARATREGAPSSTSAVR